MLQSEENRHLFQKNLDDTSSLLWLRDVDSTYTPRSTLVDNCELFDTDFAFDCEVFNSRAYREATKSHMKRAIASKCMQQRDHGHRLTKDMALFDNAMTHSIIEVCDANPQVGEKQSRELPPPYNGFATDTLDPVNGQPQGVISGLTSYHTQLAIRQRSITLAPTPLAKLGTNLCTLPEVKVGTFEDTYNRTQSKICRGLINIPHMLNRKINVCCVQRGFKGDFDESATWQSSKPKALLLGISESGKSTLLKSLKLLQDGPYTMSERRSCKDIILANLTESMRLVLEAMEKMEMPLDGSQSEEAAQVIFMQPYPSAPNYLPPLIADSVRILCQDTGVVACFQRYQEYQLPDCAR